ncbi:hypothetical protein [Paraglaciecola sp.]|uniref:hypothetical protein n=1 Tax=Paraglaciecola sp. TaxID=1920173 RepID=UPI0030F4571F
MRYIPFILEAARLLTALIRPNHLVGLNSWGLIHLLPPCNSNDFGYNKHSSAIKFYLFFTPVYLAPLFVAAGDLELKSNIKSTAYAYQTEQKSGVSNDNLALVLAPSVTGIYDSKKVDVAVNAIHTLVKQQDEEAGANKNFTDLTLNSNINLIENALNMTVNGSQNYQVVNNSQDFFSDKVLSSGDLKKIQRYSLALDFSIPNPDYIGFDLATAYSDTSADETNQQNPGLNGNNTLVSSRIYSARYLSQLTFDFSAHYNSTVRSNFSDFKSTVLSGNVRLEMYEQLKLILQGSDESYDANLENQNSGRTNLDSYSYGAGLAWLNKDNHGIQLTYNTLVEPNNTTNYIGVDVNWAFSQRTSLNMNYGKRAYGDAYQLNFQYSLKSFRSSLSYSEDITSYARYSLISVPLGIFVCSIGSTELIDCFQPGSINYVLQPGEEFRSYDGISTDITNEVILTKAANYVLGYDKRKLKLSFNLGYRETEYIETNRLQKYTTVGLDALYRLSRRTNVGVNAKTIRRDGEQKLGTEDTLTVGLNIDRKLSQNASVDAGFRYLHRSSENESRDVTDKRLTVGFKYQF